MKLFSIFLSIYLSGCATIMNGAHQRMSVSSNPSGADVIVDGTKQGMTPTFVELSRNDEHIVTLKKEGHGQQDVALSGNVSGWVWGNIIFGIFGLVGWAIDGATGAMYTIEPNNISATIQPSLPTSAALSH